MRWNLLISAAGGLYGLGLLAPAVPATGAVGDPAAGVGIVALAALGARAALVTAARPEAERRDRWVWRTVAAGLVLQIVSLLVYVLTGAAEPFPTAGDLPRIGFVLALCAAVWLLPVPRVTALERRKSALDTLTVVVSGAMVL